MVVADICDDRLMNDLQEKKRLMSGFQSLLQGMQNGGIQLSTMLLRWLGQECLVSRTPCQILDGRYGVCMHVCFDI